MNIEHLNLFIANKKIQLADAMQMIDKNSNGILFVVDDDNFLLGAISDGDVRRWILKAGNLEVDISNIMNCNPIYITEDVQLKNPLEYMAKRCIRALPIVDSKRHIVNILLAKELEKEKGRVKGGLENVSVVIMAGGKGTRLYPYTKILPKPLIPIGNIPIVERILNCFFEYGITDFIITVNYKKNMIKSYFADTDKKYSIEYVEEENPLGTGGSLKLITRKFDQPVIVTNCDILIRIDYREMYTYHRNSGNTITIVTAMKNDTIPYGVIYSKENGEIDHMVEKPTRSYFVNTGMYVINPEMIDLIPDNTFFHMTNLSEKAIELGYKVGMYPISEDAFLDMGEFAEMKRMEEKLNLSGRRIE